MAPFGGRVGADGGDVEGADCGGGWAEGGGWGGEGLSAGDKLGGREGLVSCGTLRFGTPFWAAVQRSTDRDDLSSVEEDG